MAKKDYITHSEKRKFHLLCQQTKPLLILNLLALILAITSWHLFFQNIPLEKPYVVLIVAIFPLLLVLPGTLIGSYRGAIWTCFVSLFYFMAGVLNWIQIHAWVYGVIETLLSILLFILALLFARWKGLSELPVK
ncbi:DUF2069 domain-containing protein [Marinomonas agarivorans]|nr:DUF2069 domain-containing protein [Marinomonas agarivorans]